MHIIYIWLTILSVFQEEEVEDEKEVEEEKGVEEEKEVEEDLVKPNVSGDPRLANATLETNDVII